MSIIPTQNDLSFWRWPSLQDAQKQITSFMPRFTQPISPYTFATGAVTVLAIGGIISIVAYYIFRGSKNGGPPAEKPLEQTQSPTSPMPLSDTPNEPLQESKNTTTTTTTFSNELDCRIEPAHINGIKWINDQLSRKDSINKDTPSKACQRKINSYTALQKVLGNSKFIQNVKKYEPGCLLIVFTESSLDFNKSEFSQFVKRILPPEKDVHIKFQFSNENTQYDEAFFRKYVNDKTIKTMKEMVEMLKNSKPQV